MLRDQVVAGIPNAALSKCRQLDADLTLEKAKRLVRQEEAVHDQQRQLKGDGSLPEASLVDGIAGKQQNSRQSQGRAAERTTPHRLKQTRGNSAAQDRKSSQQVCSRCGHNRHVGKEKCPAAGATCHRCYSNSKGHYSSQCFSRTQTTESQATAHELSLDTAFLDVMTTKQETTWNIKVTLKLEHYTN